jgi:osmotically-inducible protein OsmY
MGTDKDLQHQVEKELGWDPKVHSNQIGVDVKDGIVHLLGHVDTYWEKCAVESAAWRVAHVRGVANELRVELPFSEIRTDDDIALAAMGSLEWNCLVPHTVEVDVADGWVSLTGDVEWRHQKLEAEETLSALSGIKGIRNAIRIQPAVQLGDVRPGVEEALKRSALINSSHLKVSVVHGVVGLQGSVHSHAEHQEALRAAWSAPGVSAVEDHIVIGGAR